MMRWIDELHLELPFYGSRRMMFELNKEGRGVNRKRVRRLMRVMGIEALVPRPGTSKAAPKHRIYPYLLRGLAITEPNHVWASNITSRWRMAFCISWRSSMGPAGRFWLGGCRTPSTAGFASRRWRRLWRDMASRGYSIRIQGAREHRP